MLTTQSPATRRAWNDKDQRQLPALVRQFTSREIVPHVPFGRGRENCRARWTGPPVDWGSGRWYAEELGGSGGELDEFAVAQEMVLASASLGGRASLLSDSIATPHIVESGDQRRTTRLRMSISTALARTGRASSLRGGL